MQAKGVKVHDLFFERIRRGMVEESEIRMEKFSPMMRAAIRNFGDNSWIRITVDAVKEMAREKEG